MAQKKIQPGPNYISCSGEFYTGSAIVNYDSRVALTRKLSILLLQSCNLRVQSLYKIGHSTYQTSPPSFKKHLVSNLDSSHLVLLQLQTFKGNKVYWVSLYVLISISLTLSRLDKQERKIWSILSFLSVSFILVMCDNMSNKKLKSKQTNFLSFPY